MTAGRVKCQATVIILIITTKTIENIFIISVQKQQLIFICVMKKQQQTCGIAGLSAKIIGIYLINCCFVVMPLRCFGTKTFINSVSITIKWTKLLVLKKHVWSKYIWHGLKKISTKYGPTLMSK